MRTLLAPQGNVYYTGQHPPSPVSPSNGWGPRASGSKADPGLYTLKADAQSPPPPLHSLPFVSHPTPPAQTKPLLSAPPSRLEEEGLLLSSLLLTLLCWILFKTS